MTRPAYPVEGVDTDDLRYRHGACETERGDAGCYVTLPATLEEETNAAGWRPNNMPTGDKPRDLFTTGMRGEPCFDDDPSPDRQGGYVHDAPDIDGREARSLG